MIQKTQVALAIAICIALACARASDTKTSAASAAEPTAVLVELFTSEGCSSCPPADALLEKLDQQPFSNAELIVLSEHVDYWNHLGWRDPYSSHLYSERQSAYASRFGVDSYTPQMVVDGSAQFVGSDAGIAQATISAAARNGKLPVHIRSIAVGEQGELTLQIEAGPLADSGKGRSAEVYVALAISHAASSVAAGENAGHRLTHVAVVQSLTRVGAVGKSQGFSKQIKLKPQRLSDLHNIRVIVFVQEAGAGRVLGAAEKQVPIAAFAPHS